jgi:hypothetical protein
MDVTGSVTGYIGFTFESPGGDSDDVAGKVATIARCLRVCLNCMRDCWKRIESGEVLSWGEIMGLCDCYQTCPYTDDEESCHDSNCCCNVRYTKRICSRCQGKGVVCESVLPSTMSQDCCASQMSYINRSAQRTLTTHMDVLEYIVALPDGVHVMKSLRNGMYNYWLVVNGWLVGMRTVLAKFYDECTEIRELVRSCVSIQALKNKNKYSIETAIAMVVYHLQRALLTPQERLLGRAPIGITIAPEPDRYWSQNTKSMIISRWAWLSTLTLVWYFLLTRSRAVSEC